MAIWGARLAARRSGALRVCCCRAARPAISPSSARLAISSACDRCSMRNLRASARRGRADGGRCRRLSRRATTNCALAARARRGSELGRAVCAERTRTALGSPRRAVVAGGTAPRARRRSEQRHRFFGQRAFRGGHSRDQTSPRVAWCDARSVRHQLVGRRTRGRAPARPKDRSRRAASAPRSR